MSYQTRILPIDRDGGFLVATFHYRGVDLPRDVEHARFAIGTAARPEVLEDVAALFTSPLPPDAREVQHLERRVREEEKAAASDAARAYKDVHLRSAERARYGAQLARAESRRIPFVLHAARNGVAVAGFSWGDDPSRAVLRMVDVGRRSVIADIAQSSRTPLRVASPLAMALDGSRLLFAALGGNGAEIHVHEAAPGLKRLAAFQGGYVFPFLDGWMLPSEEQVLVVDHGGKAIRSIPVPGDAEESSPIITPDGRHVAFLTDKLSIWLIGPDGKPRCFRPHPGTKRDAVFDAALSDCGRWIASRADGQLVVTDTLSGQSWMAGHFPDRWISKRLNGVELGAMVPETMAFVGGRLLATTPDGVQAVELEAGRSRAYVSEEGRPGARERISVPANAPLDKQLRSAGLADLLPAIQPHFSPGVFIKTKALGKSGWAAPSDPKAPPLGASRFGGWPDLPPGTAWPQWQGRPLGFLAQLNLADAHAADPSLRLPRSGLLSFFLASGEETYEDDKGREQYFFEYVFYETVFEEADMANAWRVIYTPEGTPLERLVYRGSPLPPLADESCSVRFTKGALPLPNDEAAAYEAIPMTGDQRDRYDEMLDLLIGGRADEASEDQVGGYPLYPPSQAEIDCECGSRGIDPRKFRPDHPQAGDIQRSAPRWGLLLQITSNSEAGWQWGDGDDIFFYGDREAMERGDFSKIWMTH